MFRISLIVCVSLIFGITAKPWNKLPDEAIQKAAMSIDDNGKPYWAVEVEPPEEMDGIRYEIDPSMKIWKSMRGTEQDKRYLKAEEDLDELYHPSVGDLPQGRIQTLDVLPVAEPKEKYDSMKKAEEDKDDIDHPVFKDVAPEEPEQDWDEFKAREELAEYLAPLAAKHSADGALNEPEKDEDDLYHRDVQSSPVQVEPLRHQMASKSEARVHLEPEEDMDDVYHKDPVMPVFYQENIRAAYPVDFPSQKKHTEPEEDLDELYHR